MDRTGERYEILELGQPTEADARRAGPVLPPLDLGDLTDDSRGTAPRGGVQPTRFWRRWIALLAAFAVGVAVGTYGWQARERAADAAHEAQQSDLVAGTLIGGAVAGTRIQHLGVLLLNNTAQEIEVLSIQPLGWEAFPRDTTTVAPQRWTAVAMPVTPNCTAPVPTTLAAQIRTTDEERTVEVAVPTDGSMLDDVYEQACGDEPTVRYGASAGRVAMVEPAAPGTLEMRIELRSLPPGAEFEITEAAASTGGVTGHATNTPVSFVPVRRSPSSIQLTWQVVRCELTSLIGDINLDAQISEPGGRTYRTTVQLPGQAVAMVARFAATECADTPES